MNSDETTSSALRRAVVRVRVELKRGVPALRELLRKSARNYLTVFVGDFGQLFMQVLYFLILANVLPLHEMGVFTTVSATGMILGSLSGLGFTHQAYLAAAGRRRVLGAYLSAFYVVLVLALPVMLLVAYLFYLLIFADRLPLLTYFEVIIVEVFIWRLVEGLLMVNHGLGKFMHTTIAGLLSMGSRALGAVLFLFASEHTLTLWAHYYLVANLLALVLMFSFYHPSTRLRLSWPLISGRLRDSIYISFSNFLAVVQREIDKIIILLLVGDRAAGIYAISLRVLFLIAVPIGSFLKLYSRKLINENDWQHPFRRNIPIEAAVFVVSTAGFVVLMVLLSIWPNLLGTNIASARELYGTMIFIPAFTNLINFHNELYFAYGHQLERAYASLMINVFKSLMLVGIVWEATSLAQWGAWFNASFALVYLLSFTAVYAVLTGRVSLDRSKGQPLGVTAGNNVQ